MLASLTPGAVVGIAIVAAVALYLYRAWRYPYIACPTCKGSGENVSPSGKHHGDCRRCQGTGRKIRLISQLLGRGEHPA